MPESKARIKTAKKRVPRVNSRSALRLWIESLRTPRTEGEIAAWLVENRYASDLTEKLDDICSLDAEKAMLAAGAIAYIHPSRRPHIMFWPDNIRPHIPKVEEIDFDIPE